MRLTNSIAKFLRRAGNRHARSGDWARAADAYRRHLFLHPRDGDTWVQLGHAEKELGNATAAIEAYRRAGAREVPNPDALLHLAHLLRRTGRLEDALVVFRQLERVASIAEVTEAIRQLVSFRRAESAAAFSPDTLLFVVSDLLDAYLESNRRRKGYALDDVILRHLAAEGMADTACVTTDVHDPDTPRFALVDTTMLFGNTSAVAARFRHGRPLADTIIDMRDRAKPIASVADSVIVIGDGPRSDEVVESAMNAADQGARIALVVSDPQIRGMDADSRRAHGDTSLWELLSVANLVIVPSASHAEKLRDLLDGTSALPEVVHCDGIDRLAGAGRAATVLAMLRKFASERRPSTVTSLPAFADGMVFRPGRYRGAEGARVHIADGALRRMFVAGFHRRGKSTGWLRGRHGVIRFYPPSDEAADLVVLLEIGATAGAVGRLCSISFAGTAPAARRWAVIMGERQLFRIRGRHHGGQSCELDLWLDDDGAEESRPVAGVTAIGYYLGGHTMAGRDLSEQLAFG